MVAVTMAHVVQLWIALAPSPCRYNNAQRVQASAMTTASLTVSMPWSTNHEQDKRSRIILLQTLVISVLLGAICSVFRVG